MCKISRIIGFPLKNDGRLVGIDPHLGMFCLPFHINNGKEQRINTQRERCEQSKKQILNEQLSARSLTSGVLYFIIKSVPAPKGFIKTEVNFMDGSSSLGRSKKCSALYTDEFVWLSNKIQ